MKFHCYSISSFLCAVVALVLPSSVRGHGHVISPMSRNYYASVQGSWNPPNEPGIPVIETTPHGLNKNNGVCGSGQSGPPDYDLWLDTQGNHMPWISQAEYEPGQTILVDIKITAHHRGHFTVRACPKGNDSTQDCFMANPLEFIEDLNYGMPKDENYPHRAYLKEGQKDYRIAYKLPDGLVGSEVLLQWVYYTANSCSMDGYTEYFNTHPEVKSAANLGLAACSDTEDSFQLSPLKPSGSPEVFMNCMEVTVNSQGSTPTQPAPIGSPVASPTQPAPVTMPVPVPTLPTASQPTGGSTCVSIPQSSLPAGQWATTDAECEKCANGYNYWPCNPPAGSADLCDCSGGDSPNPAPVTEPANPEPAPVPEPTAPIFDGPSGSCNCPVTCCQ